MEHPLMGRAGGNMADEASIWTTKEIIGTVLGTGIVSGLTTLAVDYFRGRSGRKRNRTYLCIRIATALEAYAINCAELLEAADAHYGQTQTPLIISLPDPPSYPEDVDWHSVDPTIAYRIMSFLNEREAQAAEARFVNHFEGNPFGAEDAVKATGKKAHELANVLRGIAGLQPPDFGMTLKPLFK
jgi:hypothetical protein